MSVRFVRGCAPLVLAVGLLPTPSCGAPPSSDGTDDSGTDDSGTDDSGTDDSGTVPGDDDADGFSEETGDCDDADPDVHPGADEVPGDSVDDNCDGTFVVDVASLADEAKAVLEGTEELLTAGVHVEIVPDASGDGSPDIVVGSLAHEWGDPYYKGPIIGSLFLVTTSPVLGTISLADATAIIRATRSGGNGGQPVLASPGDLDGDGLSELAYVLLATELDSDVLLYASPASGALTEKDADWILAADGMAGSDVQVCRLGPSEWTLSFPSTSFDEPRLYVLTSAASGPVAENAIAEIVSTSSGFYGVSSGDIDGDGVADLAISGIDGRLTLAPGPFAGTSDIVDLGASWSDVGTRVDVVGDLDGDGLDDVVAGWEDATVILGAETLEGEHGSGDAWLRIEPEMETSWLAWDITGAGDVDGSGLVDVAIGAPGKTSPDIMEADSYVYLMLSPPPSGVISASDLDAAWLGAPGDHAGVSLSSGDTDDDGVPELLVGADRADAAGFEDAGVAYLLSGMP